jgi:hypothetical protein
MPRMRPWKLCRFFADGGGVRHGGKGWCLREWIPTIACYGRGLSIASGAPDLPPTCHTALAFSASARFPRRQTCGLADLERAPRSGAPGVVASGRVAALLSPLVSSPRAPLRGAKRKIFRKTPHTAGHPITRTPCGRLPQSMSAARGDPQQGPRRRWRRTTAVARSMRRAGAGRRA